jgi:hypothetical protein
MTGRMDGKLHEKGPPSFNMCNPQIKDILLNLSSKCWNLAFNAQGLRLILVITQVRAVKIYVIYVVKIYVTALEALRKNERQDET